MRKKVYIGLGVIGGILLLGVIILLIMYQKGKSDIMKLPIVEYTRDDSIEETYEYNTDLINLLILGVDKETSLLESNESNQGGQADVIFLLSYDRQNDTFKIFSIPRESMVMTKYEDEEGNISGLQTRQLTLQYALGKNGNQSATLVAEAVSEMLYGIPIHGYAVLSFNAFPVINDAVGGVTVTIDDVGYDDLVAQHIEGFEVGNTLTLHGGDALNYIRVRNTFQADSADRRLVRQKTYVSAFVPAFKSALMKNPLMPFTLRNDIKEEMITNLNTSELIYFVKKAMNISIDDTEIVSIPGEEIMGNKFKEFYVDDEQVFEIVQSNFYQAK